MTVVTERYQIKLMAADASLVVDKQSLGGFLAKTDGSITVNDYTGAVVVDAIPVLAGVYTPIPAYVHVNGYTVILAGGASGTVFI